MYAIYRDINRLMYSFVIHCAEGIWFIIGIRDRNRISDARVIRDLMLHTCYDTTAI